MVFNIEVLFPVFFIIVSVWLIVITVVVVRALQHYNKLTRGTTEGTLKEVLSMLLTSQDHQSKDMKSIKEALIQLQKEGMLHLQRIGIVRFNPFSDTGGSQSFSIAILDGKDNGIVMTSLFARTGNRWYIKHIKAGACEDVELSKEEQLAIKKARSF